MSNIVPEKLNNFNVYIDGEEQAGIADGNFPTGEFMTSEIRGGGIAGVIDSPGIGHMQSITIELTWRAVTSMFMELMRPVAHTLDMYGEIVSFDAGRGEYVSHSVNVFMKAVTKSFDIGKLTVNESQEGKTSHEVYYMIVLYDGQEVLMIDKYNFIYRVKGVDYLAETRRALGKM